MPERIFGRYELQRRLAIGGMGEVFLARQVGPTGFERRVILKSLLPEVAETEGAIEQFLDEARVVAKLNHPNIVSIFEVGAEAGVHFIAMEYISGCTLSALARRARAAGGPVRPTLAAKIVHDAALGLDHAHRAREDDGTALGIVHRDVSPQNIMVREDGVVKVLDFGIARAANRSTRTRTGTVKGKLAYMSPEQLRGERELGAKSDQFSLGVVFWELCAGRRLFEGESDLDIARALTTFTPRPLVGEVPGFPPELDALCQRMLQPAPARRFGSCGEVAGELATWLHREAPGIGEQDLARYLEELGLPEPTPKATPAADFVLTLGREKTVRAPARRWPVVAAGLVAALAGAGAWVATRPEPVPVLETPAPVAAPTPPAPEPVAEVDAGAPPAQVVNVVAAPKPKRVVVAPPPVAKGDGKLTLQAVPATARLIIDGDRAHRLVLPVFERTLSAGAHQLEFVSEDGAPLGSRTVEISAGKVSRLTVDLSR